MQSCLSFFHLTDFHSEKDNQSRPMSEYSLLPFTHSSELSINTHSRPLSLKKHIYMYLHCVFTALHFESQPPPPPNSQTQSALRWILITTPIPHHKEYRPQSPKKRKTTVAYNIHITITKPSCHILPESEQTKARFHTLYSPLPDPPISPSKNPPIPNRNSLFTFQMRNKMTKIKHKRGSEISHKPCTISSSSSSVCSKVSSSELPNSLAPCKRPPSPRGGRERKFHARALSQDHRFRSRGGG